MGCLGKKTGFDKRSDEYFIDLDYPGIEKAGCFVKMNGRWSATYSPAGCSTRYFVKKASSES